MKMIYGKRFEMPLVISINKKNAQFLFDGKYGLFTRVRGFDAKQVDYFQNIVLSWYRTDVGQKAYARHSMELTNPVLNDPDKISLEINHIIMILY